MECWLLFKVLVVSIVLSSLYPTIASEIWLSPAGQFQWRGNCSQPCPVDSPCLPDVSIAMGQEHCDITFLSGDYQLAIFEASQLNTSAMKIQFLGQIDNLRFTMQKSAGNIKVFGGIDSVLSGGVLNFYTSDPLEISNLTLANTLALTGQNIDQVIISKCNFTQSHLSIAGTVPNSVQVTILQTSIHSTATLIISRWNTYLTLDQVVAEVETLVETSTDELTFLTVRNSQLGMINSLVSNLSSIYVDGSKVYGLSSTASFSYYPAMDVRFQNSNIERIPVPRIGASNSPYGFSFVTVNTTFSDCSFDNTDLPISTNFTDSVFKIENKGASFRLSTFASYQHVFNNLSVFVSSSQEADEPFSISGDDYDFGPGSSLTTDRLWLSPGLHISIDYLTVSSSIATRNDSSYTATIAAATSTSSWHFDSATLSAVFLNTSLLDEFHYHATIPMEGMKDLVPTVPDSDSESQPPNKLILYWPTSSPINHTQWYPIVHGMSTTPTTAILSEVSLPLDVITRVSNTLLEYRFVTAAPCPKPPVGWRCASGVWVTDGSNELPLIVEVPPNSGVVQVQGDLTVSALVIFDGFGSSLNVSGCINVDALTVQLEGKQDPALSVPLSPVTLLEQNINCTKSLKGTSINLAQTKNFCKKLQMFRDSSNTNPSTLTVVFTVDDSKCSPRSWRWIVLGTVLGLIALIVIIAVIGWGHRKSKFYPSPK